MLPCLWYKLCSSTFALDPKRSKDRKDVVYYLAHARRHPDLTFKTLTSLTCSAQPLVVQDSNSAILLPL